MKKNDKIKRPEYIRKLHQFMHKDLIKIVTGIRRCGKSKLFELFREELAEMGIEQSQIRSINFEDIGNEYLLDYKRLHKDIKEHLNPKKMNYIFLDEIQNVKDFQKAVNSLHLLENVDLYLTGSNAYVLSGELATLLTGRYIKIEMQPLSFSEYISSFPDRSDLSRKYIDYLRSSSFPYAVEFRGDQDLTRIYLSDLYNDIILKDIVKRRNIADVTMLEDVVRFIFSNIGSLVSVKKISGTMSSDGRKIATHTVERYLSALMDSYVLYKVERYDIKGKEYLKSIAKYYVADIGLRYYLLGSREADKGHILENIIYLELIRRGYKVYIGKINNKEVDFVAQKTDGSVEYYQVAQTVRSDETLERELSSLNAIDDHNPKYLITLDDDPITLHKGIKQINAIDWLLGQSAVTEELKIYLDHMDFDKKFEELIQQESPLYTLISKNKRPIPNDGSVLQIGRSNVGRAHFIKSEKPSNERLYDSPRLLDSHLITSSIMLYGNNSTKSSSDIIRMLAKKASTHMENFIINGRNGIGGIGGGVRSTEDKNNPFPNDNTIYENTKYIRDESEHLRAGLTIDKLDNALDRLSKASVLKPVLLASQYALSVLKESARPADSNVLKNIIIISSEHVEKGIQMHRDDGTDAADLTGEYAYVFDSTYIAFGESMAWNFQIIDSAFYVRGGYACSRICDDSVIRIEVATNGPRNAKA